MDKLEQEFLDLDTKLWRSAVFEELGGVNLKEIKQ
jgi:hypothetical protein